MLNEGPGVSEQHPVPSLHTRVVVAWVSIFPLVTLGMTLMGLIGPSAAWPVWLRALLLTVVVVPISMYLVVPRVLVIPVLFAKRRARFAAVAEPESVLS